MELTLKELRRRWTIELNSLGRRERPTPEQDARKRDIQIFLCYIDPLRKLEQDWRQIKGLEKKLEAELLLQNSVSNSQYLKSFYSKLLSALIGKVLGNPSDPCTVNNKARYICEDHGERLEDVLKAMHEQNYIRKDYQKNTYSLSTVGANLMENASINAICPKNNNLYNGSALANAIKGDSLVKLAELHGKLNQTNVINNVREIPALTHTQLKSVDRTRNIIKNNIKEKPVVENTLVAKLRDMEAKKHNVAAIFKTLVNCKHIKVLKNEIKEVVSINEDDQLAYSDWTSTIVIAQIKGMTFTHSGKSKKTASNSNYEKIIEALKAS